MTDSSTPFLPETNENSESNTPFTPRYPASPSTASYGGLRVNVRQISNNFPIENALVTISRRTEASDEILDEIRTTGTGETETLELPAPPLDYSLNSDSPKPYSEYTISVTADGYEPVQIVDSEILPSVTSLQNIEMLPQTSMQGTEETFVIPDHTLYGIYPPKIEEDEIKEITQSGEIVLNRVVIPEFVVVHDGLPNNSSAKNYYVRYRDYIKNVASSEIYATWPEATIYANILAIQSFTLNRVYTEW